MDNYSAGPTFPSVSYGNCILKREETQEIYFFGGSSPNIGFMQSVVVYGITSNNMQDLNAPMSQGRIAALCSLYGNQQKAIVGGGYVPDWTLTNTVEILDLTTLQWTGADSLPMPVQVAASYRFLGTIIVHSEDKSTGYSYDESDEEWKEISNGIYPSQQLRSYFAVVVEIEDFNDQCQ